MSDIDAIDVHHKEPRPGYEVLKGDYRVPKVSDLDVIAVKI